MSAFLPLENLDEILMNAVILAYHEEKTFCSPAQQISNLLRKLIGISKPLECYGKECCCSLIFFKTHKLLSICQYFCNVGRHENGAIKILRRQVGIKSYQIISFVINPFFIYYSLTGCLQLTATPLDKQEPNIIITTNVFKVSCNFCMVLLIGDTVTNIYK